MGEEPWARGKRRHRRPADTPVGALCSRDSGMHLPKSAALRRKRGVEVLCPVAGAKEHGLKL